MEFLNQIIAFFKSGQVSSWIVCVGLVVEFWLGKTEMVKAGSTIEAVLNGAKKVIDFVKGVVGLK
jgi:hypothetical protein